MDEIEIYLPSGTRIKQILGTALFLLKGGDLTALDYVPVNFLDQLGGIFDTTIEALEALGGSQAYQGLINDIISITFD
jgi:hypothetical protein